MEAIEEEIEEEEEKEEEENEEEEEEEIEEGRRREARHIANTPTRVSLSHAAACLNTSRPNPNTSSSTIPPTHPPTSLPPTHPPTHSSKAARARLPSTLTPAWVERCSLVWERMKERR